MIEYEYWGPDGYSLTLSGLGNVRLVVSLWLPTLLAFIAWLVLFLIDRRRFPPGLCSCGYDLTGNVSGRCPECGEGVKPTVSG